VPCDRVGVNLSVKSDILDALYEYVANINEAHHVTWTWPLSSKRVTLIANSMPPPGGPSNCAPHSRYEIYLGPLYLMAAVSCDVCCLTIEICVVAFRPRVCAIADCKWHNPVADLAGKAAVAIEDPVSEHIMSGPLPHRRHAVLDPSLLLGKLLVTPPQVLCRSK